MNLKECNITFFLKIFSGTYLPSLFEKFNFFFWKSKPVEFSWWDTVLRVLYQLQRCGGRAPELEILHGDPRFEDFKDSLIKSIMILFKVHFKEHNEIDAIWRTCETAIAGNHLLSLNQTSKLTFDKVSLVETLYCRPTCSMYIVQRTFWPIESKPQSTGQKENFMCEKSSFPGENIHLKFR